MSARVAQMYDADAQREWERLACHRTEMAVTLRALADFLPPPPARILDVGGGPGRYAIALSMLGYRVTLLDLAQNNLTLALEKAAVSDVKLASVVHGNALDLIAFAAGSFDAVLMLGPLYHLLAETERRQAVAEGKRVLRADGRFFAAFISRFAPFRDAAVQAPNWFTDNRDYAEKLLADGVHNAGDEFVDAYFAHPEEIIPFMSACGLRPLLLLGCEGVVAGHELVVNALRGDAWDAWVDLNYRLGQEPSLHGAADHLLYIGEKSPA